MGFNVSWFAWAREQFTQSSNSEPGRHNSAGHRSSDTLPPTSKAPPSETTEHDDGSIPACLYLPKFSSFRVLVEKGDKGQIQAEEPKPGMLEVNVRILRLIDAGGQGCVFQAEEAYHRVQADGSLDVEPRGRQQVALKVAVAWMDEDTCAQALSREGTAIPLKEARAALAHDPGYLGLMDEVEIYGWMRRASCVPYLYWHGLHFPAPTLDDRVADKRPVLCLLSMELLGPSIRSWQLAVRSADAPQAHSLSVIRLARHMLQALQQLHCIGVVHRDIKPNNFCLPASCKPPPGGSLADVSIQDLDKIFLIDFGLAHFIGPPKTGKGLHARVLREAELARELAGEPEKKVRESDFVGTPDYASTAALHGKRQTFWDDLESLGITLMSLYDARPWRIRSTQFPRNSWGNWEESQLSRMAQQRQETWKRKVDPKTLRPHKDWTNPPPWWVVEWISVVSSDMRPRPSRQTVHTLESTFTHLHSLLNVGEKEVLASSKPLPAGMAVGNKRARMEVDAWDEVHKHTRLTLAEE